MKLYGLIILNILLGQPLRAEHEVNNGGDPFFNDLVRAKNMAYAIASQTDPSWLSAGVSAEARQFFSEKNAEYLAEIKALKFDMRDHNTNSRCGQTDNNLGDIVWIVKNLCEPDSANRIYKIAEMLLGEAAHHFKKDNLFVAELSVAITDAYQRGIPIAGTWKNIRGNVWYVITQNDNGVQITPHDSDNGVYLSFAGSRVNWDRLTGTLTIHGAGIIRKECTLPAIYRFVFDRTATRATTDIWIPRERNLVSCKYSSDWEYLAGKKLAKDWGDQVPSSTAIPDFLNHGVLPQSTKPVGEIWNFLNGKGD